MLEVREWVIEVPLKWSGTSFKSFYHWGFLVASNRNLHLFVLAGKDFTRRFQVAHSFPGRGKRQAWRLCSHKQRPKLVLWRHSSHSCLGRDVCVLSCSRSVRLFLTLRTVAPQAPLSMTFSSQEYWKMGCHFLLQGIFPIWASNPHILCPLHWQAGFSPLRHLRSPWAGIHGLYHQCHHCSPGWRLLLSC